MSANLASLLNSLASPVFWRSLAAAGVLTLGLAGQARAGITVFAAASTKTALDEAAASFEAGTGRDVALSYAGSPALARQIQLGAPADVFISANPGWMDVLQKEGLIDETSRLDLLVNRLVLIAHGSGVPPLDLETADLAGLLGESRLAMALVDAVPAGIYGKAALTALGQWPAVAPKVAQTANVRAALALVASGEAPMGVVYATDARASPAVTVIAVFPASSHPPVIYPAAAVSGGKTAEAAAFLEYLHSPVAQEIFLQHGFGVPDP
ncbi:molybdate ABC transporter substrate-binding protein [Leisingera sp. McT4-56]|uniref:molybdate ABC transporter substrate-binding protein n=1 Tax=Leisingera sp. McT4-56 TaxID=2881255 RepID=UPI001CF818C6|nr:molybdate ABC transporter substrate-binding protein [Leisingera sp. McT4-56]MCB4457919.1 molybdate ABC transporter substrate-binding protein [Leisingera sp. McT4-56]